jgi:DNA-binding MarR family transcriptional regulator
MSKPDEDAQILAWARLVRAQQLVLERVEAELKAASLPPLRWYDVLLELHRVGGEGLRQFEIGAAVLLSKYNISRLLDRMEREDLLVRQSCETDGRGAQVQITEPGRDLLRRMWPVYRAALNAHFGAYFSEADLKRLSRVLAQIPEVAR